MTESRLQDVVSFLVLIVEAGGAIVIIVGAIVGFARFTMHAVKGQIEGFVDTRLLLARFLALGLEFQLAADILRTAVGPSFEEIGKLAAVATIRTALNYFLSRDMKEESQEVATA